MFHTIARDTVPARDILLYWTHKKKKIGSDFDSLLYKTVISPYIYPSN